MKQYFLEYESDRIICGTNNHSYGTHASTLRTAKGYIGKVRKLQASENPRNFRIYDCWADVDPETDFVPCVYHED